MTDREGGSIRNMQEYEAIKGGRSLASLLSAAQTENERLREVVKGLLRSPAVNSGNPADPATGNRDVQIIWVHKAIIHAGMELVGPQVMERFAPDAIVGLHFRAALAGPEKEVT